MSRRNFYIISYDVVKNSRRNRIAKALVNFGERVQKSVFECVITEKQYYQLKEKLDKQIDRETDSIRYYRICRGCHDSVEVTGCGTVTQDPRNKTYIV
ncbi:MAG: CRISPR-associated endonuclease Cas2 [Vulcanimicrobiota bacterium]